MMMVADLPSNCYVFVVICYYMIRMLLFHFYTLRTRLRRGYNGKLQYSAACKILIEKCCEDVFLKLII